MNRLIELFLNQTLLVKIIFASVFILGANSMINIQKEGFPDVDLNRITVSTPYPGASAEDIELNVTKKLEDELSEVNGIYEITSVSRENFSKITIYADESAGPKAFKNIVNEIKQAVDQTQDLPLDLEEQPIVDVLSTGDVPIISINLFGEHETLRQVLPLLEKDIESLEGVSGVDKIGYFDREMHIEIDPLRAQELGISLGDVLNAIRARNLRTTGGTLESYLNEQTVVSLNKFNNAKDVENVILRANISGNMIRVRDLAKVVMREKDENFVVRNEGKPGMNLVVRKTRAADIIETIDDIKVYMEEQSFTKGVGFSYSNDMSERTRLRLQVLAGNALLGFALVILILMLALNKKTAFWTAMSVPFSLLACFILLPFFGATISAISLAGFVLVLGLLVDDAIVVAEKITQFREQGLSAKEASLQGTKVMWKPVLVASITTILAFTPMFSLGGMPGKFAWAIPAVVVIAILVSLFESFFILPHHLTYGSHLSNKGKAKWIISFEAFYYKGLKQLLHWRYLVLVLMIGLLVFSVIFAKTAMKFEVFPQDGVEVFFIKVELPSGASLAATEKRLLDIEKVVAELGDDELESFASRVGTLSEYASTNKGEHSNRGVVSIFLTGEARRKRDANEIIAELKSKISISENELIIFSKKRVGPPVGKPAEIRVSTNDDELRRSVSKEVAEYLASIDGVIDVETDEKEGKTQLRVNIDYESLAELGLSVKDVSDALRITYDGMLVSSTTNVSETLEYRVIVDPEFRNSSDMLYKIPVKNNKGQVLNLKDVLSFEEGVGPLEYHHVNGIRTEKVSADINPDKTSTAKVKQTVTEYFEKKWSGDTKLEIDFVGEAREQKKIFSGFLTAGMIALASIYLVVALLFNSLGQSFIVMATIPFAIIGVIWGFYAHDMPLSFFSTMGSLGLIGVVVNDTIIMVTEVNNKLDENPDGYLVNTVAQGAKDRLRPVMLTSITTVVGLLPTAYGIGGKDALIMPLTMAMAYGLAFATVITLVLTPILLVMGHDIGRLLRRGSGHQRGREA